MKLYSTCKIIVASLFVSCAYVTILPTAEAQQTKAKTSGSARKDVEGSSKKIKYKDKTDINFEDANISGMARNPFSMIVTNKEPSMNSGFLKIRYDWHDMLIMSASGLSQ